MTQRKYRDIIPFNVRMQPTLKDRLEKAIEGKVKWSINAEINKRLEDSFQERHGLHQYSDGEMIDELIRRWGRDRVQIKLGDEKP